ncbi:DUF6861 domain-containing protein [Massilia sp. W12]|uniref:DUF6861 domain-containing protein n=1 Tax=Massilia sp. W12 TaxID=3126507 RepID=UPI0030D38319
MAEVAQYLVHTMPQVLQSYKLGFWDAWGPMPHTDRMALGKVSTLRASQHFAEGHMLFTLALLSALLAWFTRGKGERFAQWLSQHGAAATAIPCCKSNHPRTPTPAAARNPQAAQPRPALSPGRQCLGRQPARHPARQRQHPNPPPRLYQAARR